MHGLGWKGRLLAALSVIWLGPTLACGSFAPRPTPTPTNAPVQALPGVDAAASPTLALVLETPAPLMQDASTPAPAAPASDATATPAAAPVGGGNALAVGQPARVTAPNGLNMRQQATSGSALVIQLGTGQVVTVLEGPVQAENFTWWRVDDGAGRTGWVADGDGETVWLGPRTGEPQAVDRAPRVGERAVVTAAAGQLSVRATPGTGGTLLTQINSGAQVTVLAGPQSADGFTWYQVRSDDGTVEGWIADGDGTTRWLSPLE